MICAKRDRKTSNEIVGESGSSGAGWSEQTARRWPTVAGEPVCPACGYSLHGLPRVHCCPECGFEYDLSTRVWSAPRDLGGMRREFCVFAFAMALVVCSFAVGQSISSGTRFGTERIRLGIGFGVPIAWICHMWISVRRHRAGMHLAVTGDGVMIKVDRRGAQFLPFEEIADVAVTGVGRRRFVRLIRLGRQDSIELSAVLCRPLEVEAFVLAMIEVAGSQRT